jgi:Flp pilus assembly protein TadD
MKHRLAWILCGLIIGATLVGCETPRAQSRRELQDQLTVRRASQIKSEELTREGTQAYRAGRLEVARAKLEKAVETHDRNGPAWLALGATHYEDGRLPEAAEAFHRAARLMPMRSEPLFNLGTVLEASGQYERAIESYESALELSPDDIQVMENLARCYIETGQQETRARELVERALLSERRTAWRRWLQENSIKLSSRPAETQPWP